MKKIERSRTKASRAARAAELLTSGGEAAPPRAAAFGFGGFSGSQQIAPAVFQPSNASNVQSAALLYSDIDGEIAQHLRRLSKRDPTTKVKALQTLVVERPLPEVEAILLTWAKTFQRLVMDNYRAVRLEACALLGVLAACAGRSLAKALRTLAGPWWLAQSDPHPDCAQSASAAFHSVFPGPKEREALVFFKDQVLDFLGEMIRSEPAALGDMHKESPEELAERHERVLSSALAALAALLDSLLPLKPSAHPDEIGGGAVTRVTEILLEQGTLKRLLNAKSPIAVRRACYSLIALMSKRAPFALEGLVVEVAPHVLGSLGDKDGAAHSPMWDMVLSFVKAFPAAWNAAETRKAVMPRLMALLRNACYGSAEVSYPAVLPFIAHMPRSLLGPDPALMTQLLSSIWRGWEVAGSQGPARRAAADCFAECLVWAIIRSPQLAGDSHVAYCDALLDSASVISAALSTTSSSNIASDTTLQILQALTAAGVELWAVGLFFKHVGMALHQQLAALEPLQPARFERALAMLQRMRERIKEVEWSSRSQLEALIAENVDEPVRESVMAAVKGGTMPAAAAFLLANIGPPPSGSKAAADLSPGAVLSMYLKGPVEGCDAAALADLLLATIERRPCGARQAWLGGIAVKLAGLSQSALPGQHGLGMGSGSPPAAAVSHSGTNGFAEHSPPISILEADQIAGIGGAGEKDRLAHLTRLLMQLTKLLERSEFKPKAWRSPKLDALAVALAQQDRLGASGFTWQVLSILLRGNYEASLLGKAAVHDVLRALLSHMTAPQAEDQAGEEAIADMPALHALDAAIFSQAVLLDDSHSGLRPVAVEALVAIFQIAWQSEGPELVETAASDPGEEIEEDLDGPEAFARESWNAGIRLAEVAKSLPPNMLSQLRKALLQPVIAGVSEDPGLVELAVQAAQSIITAVCTDAHDKQEVLDALLRPRPGWPHYAAAPAAEQDGGAEAAEAGCGGAEEFGKQPAAGTSGRAGTFSELAYALGCELGFNSITYDNDGRNRIWLMVELLCYADEHLGCAGATELLTFLSEKGRLLDTPGVIAACPGLLEGTLESLLEGVKGHGAVKGHAKTFTGALCNLLRQVLSGSDRAVGVSCAFLQGRIGTPSLAEIPQDALLSILNSIAPPLRGLDGRVPVPGASGLTSLTQRLLAASSSQPPLMPATAHGSNKAATCLASLRLVTHCFPVAGLCTQQDAASIEEIRPLISLLDRQLAGERSVIAAAAAQKRTSALTDVLPDELSDNSVLNTDEAESAVADLAACSVAYGWKHMSAAQWDAVLQRSRVGVSAAAVTMEDQAEAVVQAGQDAAAAIANGGEVAPDIALAVLLRLSMLQSAEAASKLRAASAPICAELQHSQRRQRLQTVGRGWLRLLALLLDIDALDGSLTELPSDWRLKLSEALTEALRLVFAAGVSAAFAVAAGPQASHLASSFISDTSSLWTAAARSTEAAVSNEACLGESIEAMESWSADTGVNSLSALSGLLQAADLHHKLQSSVLRLMLIPRLLSQTAQPPAGDDEDGEEDAEEAAGQKAAGGVDAYRALVAAGVHMHVAAAACDAGNERGLMLAWALLLARLLSAEEVHLRRKLAQALGDCDELISRLMGILLDLLPLEETQSASKHRRSAGVASALAKQQPAGQAAADAAQARAAGSKTWTLQKALSDLGVPQGEEDSRQLAVALYPAMLRALPASIMSWFGRLNNRAIETAIEAYTVARESSGIIAAELAGVSGAAGDAGNAEFRVRASVATREAVAVLSIEDNATLEMAVRLPPSWPLRPAEIECRRKMGVAEGRLRKWLLSINAFLRSQNGALVDAMQLWRENCVREFDGVEECLICYSVVSASDGQLPRLSCHTCSKGFHRACLYKWFRSSGKSVCPHCQSPW